MIVQDDLHQRKPQESAFSWGFLFRCCKVAYALGLSPFFPFFLPNHLLIRFAIIPAITEDRNCMIPSTNHYTSLPCLFRDGDSLSISFISQIFYKTHLNGLILSLFNDKIPLVKIRFFRYVRR